jgi:hypothetical protein
MRVPKFQGLRGRLSYANVVASLALFFALTGSAAAVNKYLVASDPITAGDLAGSTYGNPVIAAGTITSATFAPTAKAPDADKLDGIDSTQFLYGYVGGTSANSTVSVPAGAQGTADSWCPAGTKPLGGGYFAFTEGASALRTVSASFAVNDVTGAPGFQVTMANEGGAAETFHVNVRCANAS